MPRDILIDPISGIPQILFTGSGIGASGVELNVQSGSNVTFDGSQGQLMDISSELQTGVLFAVKDISGMDIMKVDASGAVTLNPSYGTVNVSGALKQNVGSYDSSDTVTFDCNSSNLFDLTLTGSLTVGIENVASGQRFMTRLKQANSGSHTVTWFDTINWAEGGTAPTLTTTDDRADMFGFVCLAVSGNLSQSGEFDGFVVGQDI